MGYVSLYRKYRPQTFDEVVGQDHVTRTLAQSVAEGRVHHAYLFTGPRGTGKTTTARVLAKALNCEQGPTPEPCNTCAECRAITAGSSVDVLEIDAASHGGVDDVRELRERLAFAPVGGGTKVYVVDECHMLSTAGWNAFLKSVEEPPGHVQFVFATTEPHKVLDTILSRTQRFDFKRVNAGVLAAHVRELAATEGLEVTDPAVDLIVEAADGSVRDALSVLDQAVAFTGSNVSAEGVADVLGVTPGQLLAETADGLAAGDPAALCALVGRLADGGHDLRQFTRDAVEHLRALFLIQTAPDADLITATPERLERLQAQAGRLGRTELLRAMELLADAQAQMRRGQTRLPLEIALCKAALPEASGDPAALGARLDRLERQTAAQPTPRVSAETSGRETASGPEAAPRAAQEPAPASGVSAETSGSRAAQEPAPASGISTETSASEAASASAPAHEPAAAHEPEAAHEPAGSPAQEPASEPAAKPAPEAGTAAPAIDLELVSQRWEKVLQATKARKRTLHALLTESRPVALEGDELTLEFRAGYDFHAEQCAKDEAKDQIASVLAEVVGAPLRVRCTVAGDDSARADTARDDRPRTAGTSAEQKPAGASSGGRADEADDVAEAEAAEAAGEGPDEDAAHDAAVDLLSRELGATVIEDTGRRGGRPRS